jgi:DNA invertase Pin-like site-specific DNA recombinase
MNQLARPEVINVKNRYCLYSRKSTESEERQVLSIDSQIKEMLQLAEREGLEVVDIKRESHSAKETAQRPIFNELLDEIRIGKYTGILTWAPDRLSRNAGDLGAIVDLMDQGKLNEIRTYGQVFNNNPNEKFLLMILGSQAKLENDNRGINVKRGLRARCEMGYWPTCAPFGYLNQKRTDKKGQLLVDPERGHVIKKIFEKVAYEKWSGRKVYHWLRFDLNFYTRGNKPLALSKIYKLLDNPFYYGVFEYPKDSGNWYQGKHDPLIDKELFDKAQEQLKRDQIVRERREFAFTKLMVCKRCGSMISAEEKYRRLVDGTSAKYIYYGCNRSKDRFCKNPYIREEDLVEQMIKIINKANINELGIQTRFEEELKKFNKFRQGILHEDTSKTKDFDMRLYAKYVLREGSNEDKRELMNCLRSQLVLDDKKVELKK